MPRNLAPGPAALRNRIRITNKSRLKIVKGNLESDNPLIPDEDEEKHRLSNLVAGVDAEDAQEHHLQAVLSAAGGASEQTSTEKAAPAVYIPTPDSNGVVENHAELYPPNKWKDPTNYVFTSVTIEEHTQDGLAGGFTYYMDERDKEWLDKNNEEARGEGTSAQGAISASSTRTSARSAKAKGKEPESSQPLVITEDEFELVMGLFEKTTHEKTEYLHHALETGMAFPSFAEYQETFSQELPAATFSSYKLPSWIPNPTNLSKIARTIYPYWKERRTERGGHRVIPTLNFDEADTLNESYVCFRRREIKAVRKTRASQATSSDKLLRLQHELQFPLDLAQAVLARETQKQELAEQSQQVWLRRMAMIDLKRKFPALGDKADEELLIEKEKPKKIEVPRPAKVRTETAAPSRENIMRPRDRTRIIEEKVENFVAQRKNQDHHWEEQIDNAFQAPPVAYPSRLFKYIPVNFASAETDGKPVLQRQSRAVRLRRGRGGRILVDRRNAMPPPVERARRSALYDLGSQDVEMEDEEERIKTLRERWRFDQDDVPAIGPEGPEEQNRMLVDEYAEKYLRYSMTWNNDLDQQHLSTDPTIQVTIDGRQQMVLPFKLGAPPALTKAFVSAYQRPGGSQQATAAQQPAAAAAVPGTPAAVPVAMQQQLRKMVPPMIPTTTVPHMRISSNGGLRVSPAAPSPGPGTQATQTSPLNSASTAQHSPPASNGVNRAAINIAHIEPPKPDMTPSAVSTIVPHTQTVESAQNHEGAASSVNGVNGTSPQKTQQQQQQQQQQAAMAQMLNGYQLQALAANPNQFNYQAGQTLTPQQLMNFKAAFANMQSSPDLASIAARASMPASYLPQMPAAANFNFQNFQQLQALSQKMPANRQQWPTAVNGVNGTPKTTTVPLTNGVDASASPSPVQGVPVRAPSANGTRANGIRISNNGTGHTMSPHVQHSPSPVLTGVVGPSQSPPRVPATPTLTKASPAMQHAQAGASKSGY